MCEEADVYDLRTKEVKSMKRCYAENLGGVVLWLTTITFVVGVLLGVASSATFTQSAAIGGFVAVGVVLGLVVPMVMATAERKVLELERNYDEVGKEARKTEDMLRSAHNFIKEFVSARDIIEHMKVVQDDYRKRVSQALITVRELAATERNSVGKLHDAIQILVRTRDEVSGGEQALRKACTLAVEHGFTPRPPEYYMGLPMPGVEGRNEPLGQ